MGRPVEKYNPDMTWLRSISDSMVAQGYTTEQIRAVVAETSHRQAANFFNEPIGFDALEKIMLNRSLIPWLFSKNFFTRNPEADIEAFRSMVQATEMPEGPRLVIDAFERFGDPTTYSLVSRTVYGSPNPLKIQSCRQRLNQGLKLVTKQQGELPIVKSAKGANRTTGFGCDTELTDTELVIVSEIPYDPDVNAITYEELGRKVYPYFLENEANDLRRYRDRAVQVHVSRLDAKVPEGVRLVKQKVGSFVTLHWE